MIKGKKGHENVFKGKNLSEKHRNRISLAHKGKIKSIEHQMKITEACRKKKKTICVCGVEFLACHARYHSNCV